MAPEKMVQQKKGKKDILTQERSITGKKIANFWLRKKKVAQFLRCRAMVDVKKRVS